jgi:hypothetical protein
MAKQDGFHPVIGTLGKTTFYRTQDGYIAREKSRLNAERIATDPVFKRTRENMAEFGRAGKAGKTMRTTLKTVLHNNSDKRLLRRMTAELMKVLKTDSTHRRGSRTVFNGDQGLLRGFEFNANSLLSVVFTAPFTDTIDRVAGTITTQIPTFIPDECVKSPSGSTHFKLIIAGAEIDFDNNTGAADKQESDWIPLGKTPTNPINIVCHVTPNSPLPLFLVCGIAYYQEVNGEMELLTSGAFNAVQIVEVNTI